MNAARNAQRWAVNQKRLARAAYCESEHLTREAQLRETQAALALIADRPQFDELAAQLRDRIKHLSA